jgi:CopG family transcriptional regulator, nickel-responsive regulator
MTIKRFGVSLEEELLEGLDQYSEMNGFPNRSQALRHLVRGLINEKPGGSEQEAAGVLIMVYDHHKRLLMEKSTEIQHDFQHLILSLQHVHLDHHHCLETLMLKGKLGQMELLADKLRGVKGINSLKLVSYSM